tara:strand:- start:36648 stop:36809 length:162 start_codon:yes stop_codon:yes gene_type:complete
MEAALIVIYVFIILVAITIVVYCGGTCLELSDDDNQRERSDSTQTTIVTNPVH